jgi:hypothetical protein
VLAYMKAVKVANILISSRAPILGEGCTQIRIKPLTSHSLLTLISAVLSALPEDALIVNDMRLQLKLGERIAAVLESSGKGVPLTPLLVRLYLDRAVQVLSEMP